jgi:hypothetical protein
VSYKVNRSDQAKPPVKYVTSNFGHYGQLTITATLGKGKFVFVDVTLSADEYNDEIQVIKYNSPLTPLEGKNFSIKLPKNINTIHGDSLRTATTAVLTLIHNGITKDYDPYTFTEDEILKKVNTLPYGDDQIELLFTVKN